MQTQDNDGTTVSVDVNLGSDVEAIRTRVIDSAARQMLMQVSPYSDGEQHFTEFARSLRDDIQRAIRERVQEVVAPAVEAALVEGVQRTDNYGSPVGPKVSLREVIVDEATKALNKKIEVRDNYGRSESVVQQVIRSEVQDALAKELKAEVKAEGERVKAAVRDKAAEIVTEAVRRAAPL